MPVKPAAPRGKVTSSPPPASAHNSPAEVADATTLQPPKHNGKPTEEAVRARAHMLWEQAGRPGGDGVEFWLRAEQELTNPR